MNKSLKEEDEWDSSPHNIELKKLFNENVVEAVKETDLNDKEIYDQIDAVVEKIKRARERLCSAFFGRTT